MTGPATQTHPVCSETEKRSPKNVSKKGLFPVNPS